MEFIFSLSNFLIMYTCILYFKLPSNLTGKNFNPTDYNMILQLEDILGLFVLYCAHVFLISKKNLNY